MQRRRSASPTDLEELTVDDRAHYKGSFPYSKGCLGAFADMSSVVCRGARRKARANRVFQDCGGGRIFGGTELLFFLNGKARVERAPPLVCVPTRRGVGGSGGWSVALSQRARKPRRPRPRSTKARTEIHIAGVCPPPTQANGFMNIVCHFRFREAIVTATLRTAIELMCSRHALLRSRIFVLRGIPGFVVDEGLTRKGAYDFYMTGYPGIQGTSTPCYYRVVLDELHLTEDALKGITLALHFA